MGLPYTVPCSATPDTTVGSTCSLDTTADALVPGTVVEGKRATWQVSQVRLNDGGPDGLVGTGGNSLFMVQGVTVP